MKPSELRGKSAQELVKLVEEKRGELFNLNLQLSTGQLTKTASIQNLKKEIARIHTILKEREKDGKTAKEAS